MACVDAVDGNIEGDILSAAGAHTAIAALQFTDFSAARMADTECKSHAAREARVFDEQDFAY